MTIKEEILEILQKGDPNFVGFTDKEIAEKIGRPVPSVRRTMAQLAKEQVTVSSIKRPYRTTRKS